MQQPIYLRYCVFGCAVYLPPTQSVVMHKVTRAPASVWAGCWCTDRYPLPLWSLWKQ
jgi:hypothetical protein